MKVIRNLLFCIIILPRLSFVLHAVGQPLTTLHAFNDTDGATPDASLIFAGGSLYGVTPYGGTNGAGEVFRINMDGSGFTVLHAFSGGTPDEGTPNRQLLVLSSTLYGTTTGSGNPYWGTIFSIGTDGTGFTTLYPFDTANGETPISGLVSAGTNLYGTTLYG